VPDQRGQKPTKPTKPIKINGKPTSFGSSGQKPTKPRKTTPGPTKPTKSVGDSAPKLRPLGPNHNRILWIFIGPAPNFVVFSLNFVDFVVFVGFWPLGLARGFVWNLYFHRPFEMGGYPELYKALYCRLYLNQFEN
jgi:hypothetical protein